MLGKRNKSQQIIKLGSETITEKGILHLLKDGDVGRYVVWLQPYEYWKGKQIRSYKNWRRLKRGTLGECRQFIKAYKGS